MAAAQFGGGETSLFARLIPKGRAYRRAMRPTDGRITLPAANRQCTDRRLAKTDEGPPPSRPGYHLPVRSFSMVFWFRGKWRDFSCECDRKNARIAYRVFCFRRAKCKQRFAGGETALSTKIATCLYCVRAGVPSRSRHLKAGAGAVNIDSRTLRTLTASASLLKQKPAPRLCTRQATEVRAEVENTSSISQM